MKLLLTTRRPDAMRIYILLGGLRLLFETVRGCGAEFRLECSYHFFVNFGYVYICLLFWLYCYLTSLANWSFKSYRRILVRINSSPINIVLEITFFYGSIRKCYSTITMLDTSFPLTYIYGSIYPFHFSEALSFIIFILPLINIP